MSSEWTSEAGPRQTKAVNEAMRKLSAAGRTYTELTGVIGGEEHRWSFMNVWGGCSKAYGTAYQELGERFGWLITRENYREVAAAFEEAAKTLEVPVVDKRITAEEDAERKAKSAAAEEERKAKESAKATEEARIAAELRAKYPWAVGNDGLSIHARAAKNLRTELARAFPHTRFSVRSETYSGGNSIDVKWTDGPTKEQVKEISDKYVQGSFDGMTDSYDYDHSAAGNAVDAVLGRVRHLFVDRSASAEVRQAGQQLICEEFGREYDPNKPAYDMFLTDCQSPHWTLANQFGEAFERSPVPRGGKVVALGQPESGTGYVLIFEIEESAAAGTGVASGESGNAKCHVEKHWHTKKAFDFWLVVLDERVEREEFETLRSQCKAAGGWYSRQWGKTPGGFAFDDEEAARAFCAEIGAGSEAAAVA